MKQKVSGRKFIGGLAVALLLPLSFFAIARLLSKDNLHMPGYYGVDRVEAKTINDKLHTDTIYHKVSDIGGINQLGQQVSINKNLEGKILVIGFFYINCPETCIQVAHNMMILERSFRKDPKKEFSLNNDIQFLSITVSPETDSFKALRVFADKIGADHDHWWFLNAGKKDVYNFATKDLFLPGNANDISMAGLIDTNTIVLVDKHRHIRGYYNGTSVSDIKRCADDIALTGLEKENRKR